MTRRHLNLDAIYAEVREELQDMSNFLDVEATRRQNETVVRLTVVTIFGLVGTVTTGFLGMNLFAWAEEPAWWRFAMMMLVFVPTLLLTFYTVMKSRRLSEFLDELSDERASLVERAQALARVWTRSRKAALIADTRSVCVPGRSASARRAGSTRWSGASGFPSREDPG